MVTCSRCLACSAKTGVPDINLTGHLLALKKLRGACFGAIEHGSKGGLSLLRSCLGSFLESPLWHFDPCSRVSLVCLWCSVLQCAKAKE